MSVRQRISKLEGQAGGGSSRDHSVLEWLVADDLDTADLGAQSPKLRRELDRMARLIIPAEQARSDQS